MTTDAILSTYLAISPGSPEGAVLRLLVNLGIQVAGGDEGSLLVLDRRAGELVFAMTVGSKTSEQVLVGQRVPLGEGLTGLAAATREVQTGAPTYLKVEQARERDRISGPQAVIAAPMLVSDVVVGVVTAISFAEGMRFGSREVELFGRLAAIAGVVVQQRRQLDALEVLKGDPALAGAGAGSASVESRILRSISRIARSKPDSLAHVSNLLEAIDGLCARR